MELNSRVNWTQQSTYQCGIVPFQSIKPNPIPCKTNSNLLDLDPGFYFDPHKIVHIHTNHWNAPIYIWEGILFLSKAQRRPRELKLSRVKRLKDTETTDCLSERNIFYSLHISCISLGFCVFSDVCVKLLIGVKRWISQRGEINK